MHKKKSEVTAKLSLCLTKHHAMKVYKGVEEKLHAFLTALDRDQWSASLPGRFAHTTHLITRPVFPGTCLNAVLKTKYLLLTRNRSLIPWSSSP